LAVQARTLEFYAQLGFADKVIEQGRWATGANLWVGGKRAARIDLRDIGTGISPYPQLLIYPQDEHERLLVERLADAGVTVERNTEMLDFDELADGVRVRFRQQNGSEETCTAAYLAGCDGARSTTRERLGIGFPGGTYEHLFYVADVQASGLTVNGELNIALERTDFLVVFPLKGRGDGRARFIGTVRDAQQSDGNLSWDDVSKDVIDRLRTDVQSVNWFSTYRVHHRVADRFRQGRCFLLGDAAHIHSPVGGQGMNTGIGDAVNLAWKLAAVVQDRAAPSLLDSYEPERIAFARRLVATTDRAFTAVTSSSALARLLRLRVAPVVVPLLFSFRALRRSLFRTVSQASVNYRGSSLSRGRAGDVRGGDRLPWVQMDGTDARRDNFEPLTSLGWQIHVYGETTGEVRALSSRQGLPLHIFPWRSQMAQAGLRENAMYLVRPDGYVAFADARNDAAMVASYFDQRGLLPVKKNGRQEYRESS
jgi:2-polyprenyl-6-methoxyphenol hydroxylase-like FAD-dependent oxidoreductase